VSPAGAHPLYRRHDVHAGARAWHRDRRRTRLTPRVIMRSGAVAGLVSRPRSARRSPEPTLSHLVGSAASKNPRSTSRGVAQVVEPWWTPLRGSITGNDQVIHATERDPGAGRPAHQTRALSGAAPSRSCCRARRPIEAHAGRRMDSTRPAPSATHHCAVSAADRCRARDDRKNTGTQDDHAGTPSGAPQGHEDDDGHEQHEGRVRREPSTRAAINPGMPWAAKSTRAP